MNSSHLPKFRHQFFISHTSSDKPEANLLYKKLTAHAFAVFLDEVSIPLGRNIVSYIQDGLYHSEHIIAVLSEDFFKCEWAEAEVNSSLILDPGNGKGRILPILIENCEMPPLFKSLKYLDAREGITSKTIEAIVGFYRA